MSTATAFNPSDLISRLKLDGLTFGGEYVERMTRADVSITTGQVTQFTFAFADPEFKLFSAGNLRMNAAVDFDNYIMRVGTIETGPGAGSESELVTIACRPEVVRKLKRRTGAKKMKNASPTDFVRAECRALKIPVVAQSSSRRKKGVSRDTKKGSAQTLPGEGPSSWTTFQRLATELNYIVFESRGTIYFGKPSWIMRRTESNPVIATWRQGGMYDVDQIPECAQSYDGDARKTVTLRMPLWRWSELYAGRALRLQGVPNFEDLYMIESVEYDLRGIDPFIEVRAATAIDQNKVYAPEPRLAARRASSIVTLALRQVGVKYERGIEISPQSSDPTAFDNAELIQWCCARVGVTMPDGYVAQRDYCRSKSTLIGVSTALRTRGALLFNDKTQSVAISLGNGRTVEALERSYGVVQTSTTADRWNLAAKIPGAAY